VDAIPSTGWDYSGDEPKSKRRRVKASTTDLVCVTNPYPRVSAVGQLIRTASGPSEIRLGPSVPVRGRTPAEFRKHYTEWAEKPENQKEDHEIIGTYCEISENPRLGYLSDQLRPLLDWRRLNRIKDPLATNWMAPKEADSPSERKVDGLPTECRQEMRPTIHEMLANFAVEFESNRAPAAGSGGGFRGPHGKTVFGPEEIVQEGALQGVMVRPIERLGSLVFATEYSVGNRGTPRGAMIRFKASATQRGFEPFERYGQPFGPKQLKKLKDDELREDQITNLNFAEMLRTPPFKYIPGKRLLVHRNPSGICIHTQRIDARLKFGGVVLEGFGCAPYVMMCSGQREHH
jgi:hypothetical protein